jgi:hypothetical protein
VNATMLVDFVPGNKSENDHLRAATQEFERAHMRADPGIHLLIFAGLGIGVVVDTEHGPRTIGQGELRRSAGCE